MTKLMEKTKAVRKTFTIPTYISEELESFSKEHHQKQSRIVALAVEQYLEKEEAKMGVAKKLDALNSLIGIAHKGTLTNIDMKDILKEKAMQYE
ncbi:MAG: hypothetical protein U9Q30_10245 [Campylobacterota bacterium]|nr:hypothetical protein [Campylobacterota bacterium]